MAVLVTVALVLSFRASPGAAEGLDFGCRPPSPEEDMFDPEGPLDPAQLLFLEITATLAVSGTDAQGDPWVFGADQGEPVTTFEQDVPFTGAVTPIDFDADGLDDIGVSFLSRGAAYGTRIDALLAENFAATPDTSRDDRRGRDPHVRNDRHRHDDHQAAGRRRRLVHDEHHQLMGNITSSWETSPADREHHELNSLSPRPCDARLLVAVFAFNHAMTGDALQLPFNLLESSDRPGFGLRRALPTDAPLDYTPTRVVGGRSQSLAGDGMDGRRTLGVWSCDRNVGSASAAWRRVGGRSARLWPLGYVFFWGSYMTAYVWDGALFLGPYYYLPMVAMLTIAAAVGLMDLWHWRPALGGGCGADARCSVSGLQYLRSATSATARRNASRSQTRSRRRYVHRRCCSFRRCTGRI